MKNKSLSMLFSAAFFIALIVVLSTPTNAALTNNWGVEEGSTITHMIEESFGDHKESSEVEVKIEKVEDLDSPPDDLADLLFTLQERWKGTGPYLVMMAAISGTATFDYEDILNPFWFFGFPIFIRPVSDNGGIGLDWDAAKTDIEALLGYDEITVTVSDDDFEVVLKDSGTSNTWGDWSTTTNINWDKGEGVLQSFLNETEYTDVGITEKHEITKGELSEGFVADNVEIIALGALGVGVLALLAAIVKK